MEMAVRQVDRARLILSRVKKLKSGADQTKNRLAKRLPIISAFGHEQLASPVRVQNGSLAASSRQSTVFDDNEKNFHAQEKFSSRDFVSARGYSGFVGEAPVLSEKQTSIERIQIQVNLHKLPMRDPQLPTGPGSTEGFSESHNIPIYVLLSFRSRIT